MNYLKWGIIRCCHGRKTCTPNNISTLLRAIESKILKKAVVKVSLEDLFDKIKEGEIKELNIISKQMSKVGGSFTESLLRLSTDEVRVNPTTASWRD